MFGSSNLALPGEGLFVSPALGGSALGAWGAVFELFEGPFLGGACLGPLPDLGLLVGLGRGLLGAFFGLLLELETFIIAYTPS